METDDISYATQLDIEVINESTPINLRRKPLKLATLIVPKVTLSDIIELCFHGNLLFSSPPSCFQHFGEFQPRKIKPGQVVYIKHIYTFARSSK